MRHAVVMNTKEGRVGDRGLEKFDSVPLGGRHIDCLTLGKEWEAVALRSVVLRGTTTTTIHLSPACAAPRRGGELNRRRK